MSGDSRSSSWLHSSCHLLCRRAHVGVMTLLTVSNPMISDEQLWERSQAGDREAFGQIVERHQSLVCALAYSACGNLSRSEDLAQEAFVAAWTRLGELREPARLRAWLCGIVRNLAASSMRRERRHGGVPETLDAVSEMAGSEADPAAQVVTREEETLLWRSLSRLPGNYREPMVLFYREQQSVAEVAGGLGLSEDTVRQRLSRGRALLREDLTQLVESALTRTRPGSSFPAGVLAALPWVVPFQAGTGLAAGAIAGKGAAGVTKGALAGLGLGLILGPAAGLTIGWFSARLAASTARSPQERKVILRHARCMILFCFAMSLGLALTLGQAGKRYPASPVGLILGILVWLAVLLLTILYTTSRMQKRVERIRTETGTDQEVPGPKTHGKTTTR